MLLKLLLPKRAWAWGLAFACVAGLAAGTVPAPAQEKDKHAESEVHPKAHDTEGEHAAAHGGAHHDETDLTHANATAQMSDLTELKSDLAIYTFLVFLLLLIVLGKFAWKPILTGLQKREQAIADLIDDARRNAEQSQLALRQHEARMAAAADETREMLAQARKDAEHSREQILADAQAAAQRERERAVADIQAARDQALHEIAEKSVDNAVALARQIIRREVQPQEHSQLIREALDKFPSKN